MRQRAIRETARGPINETRNPRALFAGLVDLLVTIDKEERGAA